MASIISLKAFPATATNRYLSVGARGALRSKYSWGAPYNTLIKKGRESRAHQNPFVI